MQKKTKKEIKIDTIKEIYRLVASKRIELKDGVYSDYYWQYVVGWNQAIEVVLALLRDLSFLDDEK